jgi:urease accessory protein
MRSLEFCLPEDVPKEVGFYNKPTTQLDVGQAGKVGFLGINLEYDSDRNKTVITKQESQVPLYVQKALHYDESIPSMAHVFILSPSGGVLQGDRYRTDITSQNNAIAHITTQGATRIYKMDENYATQIINLKVNKNSYLEFIPQQLIPYNNARYYQKVTFNVDETSTLLYSETLVPGRIAMGELFEYDICYLKTILENNSKNIQFFDSCMLQPKKQKMNIIGMFGRYTVLSTVYLITKNNISKLNEKINLIFNDNDEVVGGSSILPNDSGLCVRILSNSTEDSKDVIYNIAKVVRKQILED